jgi:hypothetical protein
MKPPAPIKETIPETIISSPLADVNNVDLFGSNDYYPTSTYSVIAIKKVPVPEKNMSLPAAIQLVDNLDFSADNSLHSENQLLKFIHSIVKEASLEHERVKTTTTPSPVSSTEKELLNIQFEEYSYIDDVIEYSNNVDDIDYSNYVEFADYSKWSTSTVPVKSTYFPDIDMSKTTVELSPSSTTMMPPTTASSSETEFVTFSIIGQTSADEIITKFESLLDESAPITVTASNLKSSTTVLPLSTVSTTLEPIQGSTTTTTTESFTITTPTKSTS